MRRNRHGDEWIGEIVRYRGLLWEVESYDYTQGECWLHLRDHYGMEDTENARASDVEVALQ